MILRPSSAGVCAAARAQKKTITNMPCRLPIESLSEHSFEGAEPMDAAIADFAAP